MEFVFRRGLSKSGRRMACVLEVCISRDFETRKFKHSNVFYEVDGKIFVGEWPREVVERDVHVELLKNQRQVPLTTFPVYDAKFLGKRFIFHPMYCLRRPSLMDFLWSHLLLKLIFSQKLRFRIILLRPRMQILSNRSAAWCEMVEYLDSFSSATKAR